MNDNVWARDCQTLKNKYAGGTLLMMPTKVIQQGKQILQLEKISEANLRRCNLDDHDGDGDEDDGENDN